MKVYELGEECKSMKAELFLIEGKIDIIADSENTVLSDELREKLELLEEKLGDNNAAAGSEFLTSQHFADEIKQRLDLLDAKVDIVANTDNSADFDDIRTTLEQVEENLSSVKNYSDSDIKITAILEVINNKIDAFNTKVQLNNDYYEVNVYDLKPRISYKNNTINIKVEGKIDSPDSDDLTELKKIVIKDLKDNIFELVNNERKNNYNISNVINYIYLKTRNANYSTYNKADISININLKEEDKNNYG